MKRVAATVAQHKNNNARAAVAAGANSAAKTERKCTTKRRTAATGVISNKITSTTSRRTSRVKRRSAKKSGIHCRNSGLAMVNDQRHPHFSVHFFVLLHDGEHFYLISLSLYIMKSSFLCQTGFF